jgi:NAD(P)-dependent dehydrogenase (short-subunit alcohol dehydrogenase family)
MNVNLGGIVFSCATVQQADDKNNRREVQSYLLLVTGHQAHKKLAAYGMTKAALEMLAKNLVIELSQYRITVNTIAPELPLSEENS